MSDQDANAHARTRAPTPSHTSTRAGTHVARIDDSPEVLAVLVEVICGHQAPCPTLRCVLASGIIMRISLLLRRDCLSCTAKTCEFPNTTTPRLYVKLLYLNLQNR